eukprot:2692066-Karenia_brevis.AAC.1
MDATIGVTEPAAAAADVPGTPLAPEAESSQTQHVDEPPPKKSKGDRVCVCAFCGMHVPPMARGSFSHGV